MVAALIIFPLLGLMVLDYQVNFGVPGIWLWPLGIFFSLAGVSEILGLFRSQQLRPAAWSVQIATLLVVVGSLVPVLWGISGSPYPDDCPLGTFGWPMAALAIGVGIIFNGEMWRYRGPGNGAVNVALGVFTMAYVGGLTTFLVALRVYRGNQWGMAAIISLAFVAKMSDTGAYACGRLLGRHKMAPILSPKKTIEGGVGGVITACISSYLFFFFIAPRLVGDSAASPSLFGSLIYGLVVATAGMLGDLAESLLKRDMQCKDSSRWMPGLGGVLDVIDSLLAAAPAAYLCWVAGLVGP